MVTSAQLKTTVLFRGIDDNLLQRFAEQTVIKEFKEGERLWRAGDPASHFAIVQRGLVQVSRFAPSGEPIILGIFGPRESIGDIAVVRRRPFPAEALIISERAQVWQIPAEVVLQAMEKHSQVTQAIQRSVMEHVDILQRKVDIMSAGDVSARLAALLLHLMERFGDEFENGVMRIPVPLSRAALSQLVSSRMETVIRIMSRWQKEGVLLSHAEGFDILDEPKLRRVMTIKET